MRYEELESLLIYIWPAGVHAKPFNHILCFTRTADSKNLYATYEDYDFMGYRKTLIHFILLAPRPSGMSLADMGPVQMRLAIPKLAWPSKAEFLCPLSKVFFSLEKWNPEYRCDALELLIGQQARLKYWHTGLSIWVERAIMKNHEKKIHSPPRKSSRRARCMLCSHTATVCEQSVHPFLCQKAQECGGKLRLL